ncbi:MULTISPECIES: ArsR/SmtB family transcription factor [Streptomyces]|uniref:Transcriptional regulator n=1 Tax=Streptomyces noursei TaxID=1971 RepID=A0A059VQR4_STRNR|nr:helix-turn-helix domain-containing protein [Streptomyces noursei]AIA01734.1 ArsR family transcriptional regulator [Streptomyces noursei]EOT03819.1 ArsR family transcriptional regulator [Streptomyces noursei CCRC 11814]EXU91727.1 ArsR family transcriptional regulator [Streptomyces noursei PD-1]MCE4943528.1 helix-turn-helix domain-containing protein [Streptomyces noursei]UWS77032.1 helix-turn-helix domain-containing protein [Streptomyces noursei]
MPDDEGHPALAEMALGDVLSALADPLRRRVVRELAAGPDGAERTCSSFALPVSKATVTHHFRTLREAGLIRQVNRGNSRMATLRRADVEQRFPGLLALLTAEGAGDA